MSDIQTAAAAAAPPARRVSPRWPIALVRLLAVITLLQVLAQAALAGGFITGRLGYLNVHSINGSLLMMTVMALGAATILLIRPGRGPWWPLVLTVVLWWMCAIQVGVGYGRVLGLHIPLGVAIMATISAFTWWSFAYRPNTKRVPA